MNNQCPFCNEGTFEVFTRTNGTKYCKCGICKEEWVNGKMMNDNLAILCAEKKKAEDKPC